MFKTWARFIRLPNCFTAMADPVAGLAIGWAAALWLLARDQGYSPVGSAVAAKADAMLGTSNLLTFHWAAAGLLAGAGFCIYAAGIIFNDLADLKMDRQKRPDRALPSGAIGVPAAVITAVVLAALGIGLAWNLHPGAGRAAVAVFSAVLLYDFLLKRWGLTAAVGMALCRGLNLLMGLALPLFLLQEKYPHIEIPPGEWLPLPLLYACHIALLTTLSWTEDRFPVKFEPPWKRQAAADAWANSDDPTQPPPPPPPSLLAPKVSFWLWVLTLVLIAVTAMGPLVIKTQGNVLLTLPGFIDSLAMLGVFALVYFQFSIFLKAPTRPNLGMTIRNGVLSIPLLWTGVVYAYGARDPIAAHTDFPGLYLPVSLAILALYLPLIAATRWLNTKDA